MDREKKKLLKREANNLDVAVRVGKQGLSENTVSEIKKLLKKRKLIKVKLLQSAIEGKDKKEFAKEIASKTESDIVDMIGFVVVLNVKC